MRHLMTVVVMVGALTGTAWAQNPNAFVGVSAVDIVVEALHDGARECNVSESGLDAAVRLPLDASRLRIDRSSADYVYVRVNVLPLQNGVCVAEVEVMMIRGLVIPNTQRFIDAATVWDKGALMTGTASNFRQRVNQLVTDYTKQLIAEWLKANPR